jgi:hypothetical protein
MRWQVDYRLVMDSLSSSYFSSSQGVHGYLLVMIFIYAGFSSEYFICFPGLPMAGLRYCIDFHAASLDHQSSARIIIRHVIQRPERFVEPDLRILLEVWCYEDGTCVDLCTTNVVEFRDNPATFLDTDGWKDYIL